MTEITEAGQQLRRAAALASGPTEVMAFLLPLWAAHDLGASPTAIGIVLAIESIISLIARPLVGVLADRIARRQLAASGAALYAASFVAYAVAPNIALVGAGAAIGGAASAFFWVALRADLGEHVGDDPAVFARLLASEEQGILVAFVIGLAVLGAIGYRLVFLLGAASCAWATTTLLRTQAEPRPIRPATTAEAHLARVARKLALLLVVTALTAGAEAGLALILLLHLQTRFELSPTQIALLFLPGSIILSVLPQHIFRIACRIGRAHAIATSLVASAIFAIGLGIVDNPIAVAVLWTIWAVSIAGAVPVEQVTIAQASPDQLGRSFGLYQAAALAGAVIAPPTLAAIYQTTGWTTACVVAATALLTGAALIPLALRPLQLPALAT